MPKEEAIFSKELKKKLQQKYRQRFRVRVVPSKRPNTFIQVWTMNYPTTIMPNDLRKICAETTEAKDIRNWDDIHYGNIQDSGISLHYNDWKKVMERI